MPARRSRRALVRVLAAVLPVVVGVSVAGPAAATAEAPAATAGLAAAPAVQVEPGSAEGGGDARWVPRSLRGGVLPGGWQGSKDRAWSLRGDATGLHLLVADQSKAYEWSTLATLVEPGFATDRWVGNGCLTASGAKAVVVYAPRGFAQDPDLFARGAFGAVVDMVTGSVTRLSQHSTLAYFNPGCGDDERAVLSLQRGGDGAVEPVQTRMVSMDTATAGAVGQVDAAGQVTSPVSIGGVVYAVVGRDVVNVGPDGGVSTVITADGAPYNLRPTSDGGLVFVQGGVETSTVISIDLVDGRHGQATAIATAASGGVDLAPGTEGRTFLVGQDVKMLAPLPAGMVRLQVAAGSTISTGGELALTPTGRPSVGPDPDNPSAAWVKSMTTEQVAPGDATPIDLDATVLSTDKTISFTVTPGTAADDGGAVGQDGSLATAPSVMPGATAQSPSGIGDSGARPAVATAAALTSSPCAIPVNDPKTQVYQPTARQAEWAVDQAVVGALKVNRPKNWMQSGSAADWSPQGMFPLPELQGAGASPHIPPQIMLGILSQESNLWQASGHSLPGVPGNPLVGNYYGRDVSLDASDTSSQWDVHWDKADCGYGISQMTDGMRKAGFTKPGEVALPAAKQRAVAVDYATNIAAATALLSTKWNELQQYKITGPNSEAKWVENWFMAVWSYNSGLHAPSGSAPWGLGWANNPANPNYKPGRAMFNADPHDAAHPQDWPYPEKVMGFAAFSISTPDGPGFRPAWWTTDLDRSRSAPTIPAFCSTAQNNCTPLTSVKPNAPGLSGEPAGPCAHKNSAGQYDLECWWHSKTTYRDCSKGTCGNEVLRFDTSYPEQDVDNASKNGYSAGYITHSAPNCARSGANGLPSNAVVVDDVPISTMPISSQKRPCPQSYGPSKGSFKFTTPSGGAVAGSAAIDMHQLGVGYGGHMWFDHTRKSTQYGNRMAVIGTWSFDDTYNGWARVLVHLPDVGAHTQQAGYKIKTSTGTVTRYAPQRAGKNRWISLGVVQFNNKPSISLSTVTEDGFGTDDVAWDAVAVQKLPQKPMIVVAMGDSYSSGEGASGAGGANYMPGSDYGAGTDQYNACRRSDKAWSRQIVLPGQTATLGAQSDSWAPSTELNLLACSGATTANMLGVKAINSWTKATDHSEDSGQYHERAQIKANYLDANTDYVVFSIGGNDAQFAKTAAACVKICKFSDWSPSIDSAQGKILTTIQAIHGQAKNAKIVVVGYPKLFGNRDITASPTCNSLPWASFGTLDALSDYMADQTKKTVAALPKDLRATFVDPRSEFANHGRCGSAPYIHGLEVKANGGGDSAFSDYFSGPCNNPEEKVCTASRETLHPNISGATAYARVVNAEIARR